MLQYVPFFLPRRLGPGFRRDALLRLAGALLRVLRRLLLGPDFLAFARLVLRFREIRLRLIGLFLDFRLTAFFRDLDLRTFFRERDLRAVLRERDRRIVFRDLDRRLVLRFGPTLCIAAQNLQ